MRFRRLLLRVMLWCLVLAAVCGVLTVLFSGHETAWRVVGTMVVTAVAAGLMMWMSVLSEREKMREAGMLGMGVIIAEWLGAEWLIWDVSRAIGAAYRFEERVAMSMLFGAGTALWAMLSLGMRRRKGFGVAGVGGLVLAGVVGLLWAIGTWWPRASGGYMWADPAGKLLESSGAAAVMGVLGTILLVNTGKRWWWALPALCCGGVALGLWLAAIWMDIYQSNGAAECIASVAVVGAFCNAMRMVRLRDDQWWLIWLTMGFAVATGLLVDVVIVLSKQNTDVEFLGRLAAAGGILTACGMLASVVLARLNRQDIRPMEMPAVSDIAVVCPVCQRNQKLRLGEAKCEGCGLLFEITVKEPRCPQCNYLLLMSKSNRCPECGRAV